jgi:hypothetical protein
VKTLLSSLAPTATVLANLDVFDNVTGSTSLIVTLQKVDSFHV